jgi:DNA-binding NtrC family response regulator
VTRILCIDEDVEILKLYEEILKDYEVVVTQSAVDGYKKLCQNGIDLVITELLFENTFDGNMFISLVRQEGYKVPIIVSSYRAPNGQNDNIRFLQKPFSCKNLKDLVNELMTSK